MAKNLRKMTIREVSLVDSPASPGAVVLFSKRRGDFDKAGPPDEARDDHGRWTADGIKQGIKEALHATRKLVVNTARDAYAAAGHTLRSVRVPKVQPVKGGGVQFTVTGYDPGGGKHVAMFQVRPHHLEAHPKAATGLNLLQRALEIYNIQGVEPTDFVRAWRGGTQDGFNSVGEPPGGWNGTGNGTNGNGTNGDGGNNGGYRADEIIGYSTGKRSNMTPEHAGGRPYYNKHGNFIRPGTKAQQEQQEYQYTQQHFERQRLQREAARRAANTSSSTVPRSEDDLMARANERFKTMFESPADPEPPPVKPPFGFKTSSGSTTTQTPPPFNPNTVARSATQSGYVRPSTTGSGAVNREEAMQEFLDRGGVIDKLPPGTASAPDDNFLEQNRRSTYPEDYNKRRPTMLRFFF